MKRLMAILFGVAAVVALPALSSADSKPATAILAGGCFWCMEHDFKQLDGVSKVVSGYAGGSRANPTYENYHDVDADNPVPHVEVVEITYDAGKVDYDKLLDFYFRHIDPTDGGGQFCDRGPAYRPVIFTASADEKSKAEAAKTSVEKLIKQPVAVEVQGTAKFWLAEDYHQAYAETHPTRYKFYRWNCGRDQRVEQVWSAAPPMN